MDYLSDFGSVYESNSNPNSNPNPNPNPQAWYIRTITRVFELAGGLVQDQVASNLMVLIAEGSEDEELDAEMRAESVAHMVELLVTETDPKTICILSRVPRHWGPHPQVRQTHERKVPA